MRSVQILLSQCRLLLVLVPTVLLLNSLGEDVIFHPQGEFDSFEITIPEKLSFRGEVQGVVIPVSYLLRLKGKKHVLHLWPKRFLLPRHLRVFSFTEHGELLEDHPYIPKDCNYMGSVEESLDSKATISTCMGGLRGVFNIDAKHYQIEPLKASPSFEHVVYFLKKEQFGNQVCGLSDDEIEWQMAPYENKARLRDYPGSYKHPKYLELILLFDHSRYSFVNNNLSQVIHDGIILTAIMDTYFQDVRMRIHLKALEVWTDFNKIRLGHPALADVLGRFVIYKKSILNARLSSDWAHLYLQRKYNDALAWSFGKVCSLEYAGSVSTLLDANILAPATWSAHELGHAVGMLHDEQYCQCRGRLNCIMGSGRSGFSNCSYISFFKHISSGATCLNNIPGIRYVFKRCGNKIVEDNEECDCGSTEECQKDRCCQSNCKLQPGANCSTGLCCHGCRFRPSGYMCRQEENECDLAEYCDGNSSSCPNDVYKQDGTPCKYKGRCIRKGCRSRYMQCQSIFGPDAMEAPSECYDAVNLIGDQFGNCEITGIRNFKKCESANSICGRLQCINVKTIPDLPEHTTIISTHLGVENLMCWGTGYHLSMKPMGIPDLGMINDGTSCGEDRVCFNKNCVNSSVLQFDCLPEKCNTRGVCNNRKNCHCMYGWAPPFCEEVGYGGSIDSGPPGLFGGEIPRSIRIVSIIMFRLFLLILSAVFVFFRQEIGNYLKSKQEKMPPSKAETEQEESKTKTGEEESKAKTEQEASKAKTGQEASKAKTGQEASKAKTGQEASKANTESKGPKAKSVKKEKK
ncbi:PREDICTED: disintegrin and metalloproteinase domain-containing protein 30 [Cercocebus atys]|uniref:disintegrin and metalloproteinase domain-containing protein 30 n=1 Tax=Cercocebus atys TaxID=9531 RepID=UPI0005F556ED|nr:PREDICTED: disintegrin and metalloproteinase domain-containing protein 30 [Cercocebus atys]